MALSRKHYEAVAGILADNWEDVPPGAEDDEAIAWDVGNNAAVEEIARRLAEYFATENPNFNRERFLKAAGAI